MIHQANQILAFCGSFLDDPLSTPYVNSFMGVNSSLTYSGSIALKTWPAEIAPSFALLAPFRIIGKPAIRMCAHVFYLQWTWQCHNQVSDLLLHKKFGWS
mmetsp:Transcript_36813/g.56384  ORF Transcript_36813/g.56384 Transcript_36813/m.56384 type:complete len:100 (+) Transcript_36813:84-383(+)